MSVTLASGNEDRVNHKHLEIGYTKILGHSFNCGVMHNSSNVMVVEELDALFFFLKFIISSISQDDNKEFIKQFLNS